MRLLEVTLISLEHTMSLGLFLEGSVIYARMQLQPHSIICCASPTSLSHNQSTASVTQITSGYLVAPAPGGKKVMVNYSKTDFTTWKNSAGPIATTVLVPRVLGLPPILPISHREAGVRSAEASQAETNQSADTITVGRACS